MYYLIKKYKNKTFNFDNVDCNFKLNNSYSVDNKNKLFSKSVSFILFLKFINSYL